MRTFVRWWLNFDGWRTYCACLISACWMMHKRFGVFVLCSASLYKIWKICGIANVLRPHTDRHIRIYLHCRIAIVAQRPQVFFVVVARNWFWSTICPVILFFRIFFPYRMMFLVTSCWSQGHIQLGLETVVDMAKILVLSRTSDYSNYRNCIKQVYGNNFKAIIEISHVALYISLFRTLRDG